jgi:beta-glucanase (GH16 family)
MEDLQMEKLRVKDLCVLLVSIMVLTMFMGVSSLANEDPQPLGINGSWDYLSTVSDEFNSPILDETKWDKNCLSWSDSWSWEPNNVSVSDGILNLKMSYEPHSNGNISVYGWNKSTTTWGIPWSFRINESPRTGDMHLRNIIQDCYGLQDIITYQDITVPNGVYQFKAYAKSSGGQQQAAFRIKNYGGNDIVMNINASSDYTLYQQTVNVTTGSVRIEIACESEGIDKYLDVDDVSLIMQGESTNRVVNGSFDEQVKTVAYKSAAVVSKEHVTGHAYYEARIKAASRESGICPAFWATHYSNLDHREIDFLELQQSGIKTLDYVLHLAYSKTLNPQVTNWIHPGHANKVVSFDPRNDYHVYGCEITDTFINFYLDGIKVATIDAAKYEYGDKPYNVWLSMGLRGSLHTSPTASGFPTTMQVDYLRVWKNNSPAWTSIDDYDESVVYTGTWNKHSDNPIWYGGTIHASATQGSSSSMVFNGTSVKLYGRKARWCGIMDIYIDDILVDTVDTYSYYTLEQQLLYEDTSLSSGEHTIKVVCKRDKSSSAINYFVHVDRFEYQ